MRDKKAMANPTRDEVQVARSLVLKVGEKGTLDAESLQEAIAILEKAQIRGDRSLLEGEWRLLWTSGTRKSQKFKITGDSLNRKATAEVLQRIDMQRQWFENQVALTWGSLTVGGPFEYKQHRIQFHFKRVGVQLGTRRGLTLPLGKWASGWLQTTYLDEGLHLERGDRGGISVYRQVGTSPLSLYKDNDRIIL